MDKIEIKGKIEFIEEQSKQYNREFTATLTDASAFSYGNRTAVEIEWGRLANGYAIHSEWIDTRYDTTIRRNERDFKKWVQNYFANNFGAHVLTLY